jgi:outer membrane lipoprotein-sorting protein
MSEIDELEIIRRFEAISQFEPKPEVAAGDLERVRQRLNETAGKRPVRQQHMWRIIMKSRITKLAAAAVIILAVFLAFDFTGVPEFTSITWADVRQAFSQVDNVHVVKSKVGPEGGRVVLGDIWAKRPSLLRMDRHDGAMSVIDNGSRMLTLDNRRRRAQFSATKSVHVHAWFAWLGYLRGQESFDSPPLKALGAKEPLLEYVPYESTDETAVYEGTWDSAGAIATKIWVNRATKLLEKQVATEGVHTSENDEGEVTKVTAEFEYVFDYNPIPDEMFSMVIPQGYTECEW